MTTAPTINAGTRFAFAPYPVPIEGLLYRIYVVFESSHGDLFCAGTDLMAPRESLNNPMFAVSRGRGGLDVKLDDIADRPGAALVTGYGANRRYPRRSASFPAVPPAAGRLLPCHPVA